MCSPAKEGQQANGRYDRFDIYDLPEFVDGHESATHQDNPSNHETDESTTRHGHITGKGVIDFGDPFGPGKNHGIDAIAAEI
jgi:hypothetical protein